MVLFIDGAGGVSVSLRVDDMNIRDEFLTVLILRLLYCSKGSGRNI